MIISYKMSRVDDRMLCEVALYGGPLGAIREKKVKIAYCRLVKSFAVAPSHACF